MTFNQYRTRQRRRKRRRRLSQADIRRELSEILQAHTRRNDVRIVDIKETFFVYQIGIDRDSPQYRVPWWIEHGGITADFTRETQLQANNLQTNERTQTMTDKTLFPTGYGRQEETEETKQDDLAEWEQSDHLMPTSVMINLRAKQKQQADNDADVLLPTGFGNK